MDGGGGRSPAEIARIVSLLKVLATARRLKEDSAPVRVVDRVFVGSIGAAHNREGLLQAGVSHVLCVAGGLPQPFTDAFQYLSIPVTDTPSEDLARHFDACFAFIDGALADGGAVLVHCFAGKSRSVTVLLAWLMRSRRCSLQAAMTLVQSVRPSAAPNAGFLEQLASYEAQLAAFDASEGALGRMGALAGRSSACAAEDAGVPGGAAAGGGGALSVMQL